MDILSPRSGIIAGVLAVNLCTTLFYFFIITNENRKKKFFGLPTVIQKLFVLFFTGPLFISPFLPQVRFRGALGELGPAVAILGVICAIGGLSLIFAAFFKIGAIPSIREKSSLATKGAYGIVRHPIYCGTIFLFCGLILVFGALVPLLYLPLSVLLYYGMTVLEERGLVSEYGQEYLDYRAKVRKRIIPLIL